MRRMSFLRVGLSVIAVLVFSQMTFAADMLSGTSIRKAGKLIPSTLPNSMARTFLGKDY